MTGLTVALVGFEDGTAQKCRESLVSNALQVIEERDIDAALAGIMTRRSDAARPELYAAAKLDRAKAILAAKTVRAHPLAAKAGLIVVSEVLSADDASLVLDAGADDCYTRPFLPAVFCARVRAVLRGRSAPASEDPGLLKLGPSLVIYPLERKVLLDRAPVALSRGQFDLLFQLARSAGTDVPGKELIAVLAKNLLYVTVPHVRRELEELQSKLGRLGPNLQLLPEGGARFAAPAAE